jgi:hypothetical protein
MNILTIRELAARLDSPRHPLVSDDPGPILYSLDLKYLANQVNDREIWEKMGFEMAWIHEWCCTANGLDKPRRAGFRAIYLDGRLVGMSERHSSRSDELFSWLDHETAMLVRERVMSFIHRKPVLVVTSRQYWPTHMSLHSDCEVMQHHLDGQVLCQGLPGRVTRLSRQPRPAVPTREPVIYRVKLDNGDELEAKLADLLWALPLRPEEPGA